MSLDDAAWRKSKYSTDNGGECVEVVVIDAELRGRE
jgi:hypothetical protein